MSRIKTGEGKGFSRRDFLKMGGTAVAATATRVVLAAKKSFAGKMPFSQKRLAMVIDLQRCTGCGGYIISCKNENNLQKDVAWSNKISKAVGRFPHIRYEYLPTLCNHCESAPCVGVCPTGAMHKGDADITMHNPEICIGCKKCMDACPYNVIYFNAEKPHRFWRNDQTLIEGGTSSPKEVAQKVNGRVLPFYNPDREKSTPGTGIRREGVVEKYTFCDHRLKEEKLPYCVQACPAKARIFGDLNDSNSEASKLLGRYRPFRLEDCNYKCDR